MRAWLRWISLHVKKQIAAVGCVRSNGNTEELRRFVFFLRVFADGFFFLPDWER